MTFSNINKILKAPAFKKYFTNTSWMLAERILNIIAGVFIGIWVARFLGPEKFGALSYAMALITIFISITKLGLNSILSRELVNHPEKNLQLLGTSFTLQLIAAFACILLVYLIMSSLQLDVYVKTLILIISISLLFRPMEVIECYFDSKVQSKFAAISKSIQLLITSILKIALIIFNADVIYFALVIVVEVLILSINYLTFFYFRTKQSFFKYFDLMMAKKLLTYAWPFIIISVVHVIYTRIDQLMIGNMLGTNDVGLYSAAIRLYDASLFIPVIITSSLFPAILNAKIESLEHYHNRLQQLFTLMFALSLSISIGTSIIGPWLVPFLFGEQYETSGKVLSILIWSTIFIFWGVARSKWILAENLQKYALFTLLIGVAANIVLNYLWIPLYGINGAAAASVLSNFIGIFISPLFITKFRLSYRFIFRSLIFKTSFR
jgi:O-antigen/teichoic acid export membrane protein